MRITTLLAVVLMCALTSHAETKHPNILFLVADEYRADCLGVAGHPIVKTPNFDALARGGVHCTHAFAAAPVCSPSRATLFTGRYPQIHGVTENNAAFAPGEVTLPRLLRAYGYTTGIVGKLHLLNYKDWFDFAQISAGGGGEGYRAFLTAEGFQIKGPSNTAAVPGSLVKPDSTSLRVGTSVLPESKFEEAWEADQAIDFIRKQTGSGKPWFLFLSMLKPHSEYVIPAPYDKMYDPRKVELPRTFKPGAVAKDDRPDIPLPKRAKGKGKDKEKKSDDPTRHVISDEELLREVIAHYYGAITMVDKHMGRVIAALDEMGLANDTVIVFTADHGNMLGERNRMFKTVMYDGSSRVPMIFRAPGRIPAGKTLDTAFDNTAVMPTLLDLAGLPIPAGVQGKSMLPAMLGNDTSGGAAYSYLADKMVDTGEWKLIVPLKRKDEPELYHMTVDRDEQTNLYGKPEGAQAQARLTAMMEKWMSQEPPKLELPK